MQLKIIQFTGFISLIILFSACNAFTPLAEPTYNESKQPAIIPLPVEISWKEGQYKIPEANKICFTEGGEKASSWLKELLRNAGLKVKVVKGAECGNWNIQLDADLTSELGEEGYKLEVDEQGVSIKSGSEAGLFYGIQTLRQMFPPEIEQQQVSAEKLRLRMVEIEDKPLYTWRGTMVDVARSFFGIEYLKRHIDRMALYKLNRLHLHLSDDQGWRIEIKSKPKLTKIGASGAVKGGNSGFLTQKQYKELQEYALARNIIIVPEIDLPGHVYAALVSYPELNCPGNTNIDPKRALPPELYTGYNVGWSKLCLQNPETYDFVSDVIEELSNITTGPWIHLGGDEIEDPLYEEFVVKADSIVRHYGKTSIGWEEVTKAEVDESLISQNWHGTTESIVKVKIIESICSKFYLDHGNFPGQENTHSWCKKDGVSLKDVYSYSSNNPMLIGVEAPVWTEYVLDGRMLDDRFWPRAAAVAEVAWSSKIDRDFSDFINRLALHGKRLNAMGVYFHPSPEVEWMELKKVRKPGGLFSGFSPSK